MTGTVRSLRRTFASTFAIGTANERGQLPGRAASIAGRGLTVALIGPDGAGKSSVARRLPGRLEAPARYVYMGVNLEASNLLLPTTRLALAVKRARGQRPDLAPSSGAPTSGATVPLLRVGRSTKQLVTVSNLVAEEWFRQLVIWWHRMHGRVVVLDRHFLFDYYRHDVVPQQPVSAPRRFHGFLLRRVYPRPDLVLLLDAPADVLFGRKPEGTVEQLERRRQEYLTLPRGIRGAGETIDTSSSLEEVVERAAEAVRQHRRSLATIEHRTNAIRRPACRDPETNVGESSDTVPAAIAAIRALGPSISALRGDPTRSPDASVIVPVNARSDLDLVVELIGQLAGYEGTRHFEIILVVNNYPPSSPPEMMATYEEAGIRVVGIPDASRPGEVVCFSARIPGVRAASSSKVVLFDADCRVERLSELLDWYVEQLERGAALAYTHVGHFDLQPRASVYSRVFVHHASRFVKRSILRIPTTRGSGYAVERGALLAAYDGGLLVDDFNVAPTLKAQGRTITYSGSRRLVVRTSGRMIKPGWLRMGRYFARRLRYNVEAVRVQEAAERSRWLREYIVRKT
jgi:thymidylate kinase